VLSFPTCFQYFIVLLFIEHQPQVEKIVTNQLQMMMTCWMSFWLVSHFENIDSTPASPSQFRSLRFIFLQIKGTHILK